MRGAGETAARPSVSVVVASFNYADLIGYALDSVLSQTFPADEIIVVDDGSHDDSVAVVRGYAQKHPSVKLYQHEGGVNKGLPATLALGVAKATGDWVAFCEADDMWEPTCLEERVQLIAAHAGESPKIVINDVVPFGDSERCRAATGAARRNMARLPDARNRIGAAEFRKFNLICTFSCCMVDRKTLAECDFASCPRPANIDWWLWRQICCVNDLYVVHKGLTKWRMHESFLVREPLESLLRHDAFLRDMDRLLVRRFPAEAAALAPLVEERERFSVVGGRLLDRGDEAEVQPFFSVIMPTYNRAFCIERAIDSLLGQTYGNFELVIVDDASTDGTADLLRSRYPGEIASGRIKYVLIEKGGVSKARNAGLRVAGGEWIAYLDSDNEVVPTFLETFARAIAVHPDAQNLYAKLICRDSRRRVGAEFDLGRLLNSNYIDLGVYVHRRALIDELGPFDENMTRLVDWELIARQCKEHSPVFIDETLLVYADMKGAGVLRITTTADLASNREYFHRKHGGHSVDADGKASFAGDWAVARAFERGSWLRGVLKRLVPYAMQKKFAYRKYGIRFPELGAFWSVLPFGLVCMLKRMDPDNGVNMGACDSGGIHCHRDFCYNKRDKERG